MKTKLKFIRLIFTAFIMLVSIVSSCSSDLRSTEALTDKKLITSAAIANVGAVISSFKVANKESFYGIYSDKSQWSVCTVNSSNTIRRGSGSYVRKLTDSEKDLIGSNIDFRIELSAAYDIWDRNAYSWYIKVPKGTTTLQNLNPDNYAKVSFIHYTTPYFKYNTNPNSITYRRDISEFAQDIKDKNADVYIGYDVEANPTETEAGKSYCDSPGFKADIFIDTKASSFVLDNSAKIIAPVMSKQLSTGSEITTVNFTLGEDISNAYIRISTSGHSGQEEGRNRDMSIYIDNTMVTTFNTKVVCTPYEYYDKINPYGARCNSCTWRYPWRNWCQGGEVAPRTFKIGNLTKGSHSFKIDAGMLTEPPVDAGRKPMDGYFITYAVIVGDRPGTSSGTYQLISAVNNSSVLDVAGAGTSNNTKVQLWDNANVPQQKWKITSVDGGYYKLQPLNAPTLALDVSEGGTTDGTQIIIFSDSGANNQKWQIIDVGGGYFSLAPANAPTKRLDVNGAGTSNGTKVHLWTDNGGNAQKWKLIKL